jgi:hypothetical protein
MEAASTRAQTFGAFSTSVCPSLSTAGPLIRTSINARWRASARRELDLLRCGEKALAAVCAHALARLSATSRLPFDPGDAACAGENRVQSSCLSCAGP